AGPLGVLRCAEQGADVINVEPPGCDPFRDYSGDAVWNRSRRSVTVDLKQPAGADAFRRLAADADVLVETFRPGVTDGLGVGFDALHEINSRLVYCSCPAYPAGHRLAPRPGYDALVPASSGQQWKSEVATNKYVHASIMSGLAPVKTQDAILGLPDPSDPEKYMVLSPEERAELTPKRRAAYKLRKRDELIAEFRENNHAIEAIESMEVALGASGEPHPQLAANGMVATVDDPA